MDHWTTVKKEIVCFLNNYVASLLRFFEKACAIFECKGWQSLWIVESKPLLTRPSHGIFVLTDFGEQVKSSSQLESASQSILTNRYERINFIQLKLRIS